jgi:hypothetical protein
MQRRKSSLARGIHHAACREHYLDLPGFSGAGRTLAVVGCHGIWEGQ